MATEVGAGISLRDIHFSYRNRETEVRTPVLKGVDLECRPGELVAIQGPSGSGKSTLLYLMGGMLTPDRGQVLYQGRDLTRMQDRELAALRSRQIGFVFQQFHLLPRASVLDNILLPTRYITQDGGTVPPELQERARSLAARLGLAEHLNKSPNQLSGGQQQRVAIARALLLEAPLLLADEPTGNLDTENSKEVMKILREEARAGKCVIVITHESEVAALCDRIIPIRDGRVNGSGVAGALAISEPERVPSRPRPLRSLTELLKRMPPSVPLAWDNLKRTKVRTALTLIGVTIGIAAVLSMLTIGAFVRDRLLSGYEALGVNKVVLNGSPNWELKATDPVPAVFKSFDPDKDIESLRRIFPQIVLASPIYSGWRDTIDYGGNEYAGARVMGVNLDYAAITNRRVAQGSWLLQSHILNRSPVCVVGSDIAERIFPNGRGVGEVAHVVTGSGSDYTCRVIGILDRVETNVEGDRSNEHVLIPYSFFPSVSGVWESNLRDIAVQVSSGADVLETGTAMRGYFMSKYGSSIRVRVNSDAVLVAQMQRFIGSFRALLISIAFLSLAVGGIGITNMMLVSVSERFREIGLRKAVGATRLDIRAQFLTESVLVCSMAGFLGIGIGFFACELLIYIGSNVLSNLEFAWVFHPGAWAVSSLATLGVGILSGIVPAWRAEKLEVIEALRSE